MERMDLKNKNNILYNEHIQRYLFVKPLLSGNVLDIACGIGYGSQIIIENISKYTGIDFSHDAISDAKKYYNNNNKINFVQGDITNIIAGDKIYDCIISFETLEHIIEPDKALIEIYRVLKPDGIFVGSVPSQEYDDKCEKVYGSNPYHVTRFDVKKIKDLLSSHFKYIELFANELLICNIFNSLQSEKDNFFNIEDFNYNKIFGSIIFIATNDINKFKEIKDVIKKRLFVLESLVEYDQNKELPLRKTISNQTKMIKDKDNYINELLSERQEIIKNYEQKVSEAVEAIKSQDKLVEERDKYIKELEKRLNG